VLANLDESSSSRGARDAISQGIFDPATVGPSVRPIVQSEDARCNRVAGCNGCSSARSRRTLTKWIEPS